MRRCARNVSRHVVFSSCTLLHNPLAPNSLDERFPALRGGTRSCSTAPSPPPDSHDDAGKRQQQQQAKAKPHPSESLYRDVDDPSHVSASTFRTMYPPVKLKARSEHRPQQARQGSRTALLEQEEQEEQEEGAMRREGAMQPQPTAASSPGAVAPDGSSSTTTTTTAATETALAADPQAATSSRAGLNEIQQFLEEVQDQKERAHRRQNAQLPYPIHPDVLAPRFRRIKRKEKLLRVDVDPEAYPNEDAPRFARRDVAIALPPARPHPWLGAATPIGPFITHGDGQINMRGGTGEVGFDGDADTAFDAYHGTNDAKRLRHLDPHVNLYGREKVKDRRDFGTMMSETNYAEDFLARYKAYQAQKQAREQPRAAADTIQEEQEGQERVVPLFEQLTLKEAEALSEQLRAMASQETMPHYFRGLQHTSLLQRALPQRHGTVRQDMHIKHSFSLTGRGVFATKPIAKGEIIMLMADAAHSVGVRGETERLEDMIVSILQDTLSLLASAASKEEFEAALSYLHTWILNGQPSALLEHWPKAATQRVIDRLGGGDGMLLLLELHPIHIARMAAIIDMNAFLVESYFAQRKGMAYFPEAGFFNHSCGPNAEYDIMPEHVFKESDYCLDETLRREAQLLHEGEEGGDDEGEQLEKQPSVSTTSSTAAATTPPPPQKPKTGLPTDTDAPEPDPEHEQAPQQGDAVVAHPHTVTTPTTTTTSSSSYPDLTPAGAPTYLFCCRAARDIAAGEEILIAYVPPAWTFDQRQQVLHDRYKFWCKCPRCAPVLDSRYARVPKYVIALMVSVLILQGWLMAARHSRDLADQDEQRSRDQHTQYNVETELQKWKQMAPEVRQARLRELGLEQDDDVEKFLLQQQTRQRQQMQKKRNGLLELLAQKQADSDVLLGQNHIHGPVRAEVLAEERRKMGKA